MDASLDQLASEGETNIKNAEAQARAAQIFAEMMGLVCHQEFIDFGDQMVNRNYLQSLLTARPLLSTSLVLKYPFIGPSSRPSTFPWSETAVSQT